MNKITLYFTLVGLLVFGVGIPFKTQAQDPNTSLWISASVDQDSISQGSQVTISLTIQKDSTLGATNVQVTNTLGSGLTYLSHTAPATTTFNSATGIWTIGNAFNDPSTTSLTLTLLVEASNLGVLTSVAGITQVDQPNLTQKDTLTSICVSVPILICEGDSVELKAPANLTSYQWYKDQVEIPNATDSILIVKTTGSYSMTTTTALGCSSGNCCPLYIIVSPRPVASVTGNLTLCPGGSTTLTAVGGTSFRWSTGDTTAAVTLSPAVTTDYFVVVSNGSCTDTAFVTLNVNPDITASVTGNLTLCPGGSTTLTAAGGTSFRWSTGDTTAAVTLSPAVTTDYFVVVSNGSCTDTAFVTLNVNPDITASVTGNLTLCPGGSTTLTAAGGTSFRWSTSDTTAAVTVSPVATTIYTVVVGNSGGCQDTTSVQVHVSPAITYTLDTACDNNNTPNDNSDDTFTFTLTPAGGSGTTYAISGAVTASGLSYGVPYSSASFLISSGAKSIVLTDSQSGCTINITIMPPLSCSSCPPQLCVPVTMTRIRK